MPAPARSGARLIVADLNAATVEGAVAEFGVKAVEPDEIPSVPCDVLAPCALGAVVNDASLGRLRYSIIAGSANNVLAEARHGEALAQRGILYAPDYVTNAGGLINVADKLEGYNHERATKRDGVPTNVAADTLTLERIAAISSMERLHTGHPYGMLRRSRETI